MFNIRQERFVSPPLVYFNAKEYNQFYKTRNTMKNKYLKEKNVSEDIPIYQN